MHQQLLVFAGSTRQQSFNRKLAHAAAAIAREAGARVTTLELSDFDIPMYNADLEAQGTPADVLRLKQVLHALAGLRLALLPGVEFIGGTEMEAPLPDGAPL